MILGQYLIDKWVENINVIVISDILKAFNANNKNK